MQLTGLFIYPLKAARGIALASAELTAMGLQHDRRWMLVSPEGQFITQRTCPQLARLQVGLADCLRLGFEGQELEIPLPPYQSPLKQVMVWRSCVLAQTFGPEVNHWLQQVLGLPCELVYMPDDCFRATNPVFAPGQQVSFADGYPYLLTTEASLASLNAQLRAQDQSPVTMDRFRPNLVLEGAEAFAEDRWQQLRMGQFVFEVVKPCERCLVINTDQLSGERSAEPLRTLAQLHRIEQKVIFGQNLIGPMAGRLQVGQLFEVSQYR